MTAMTRQQLLALPAILDCETTARALGVSTWTVRQMANRGDLASLRLGRLLRFRLVDVLKVAGIARGEQGLGRPVRLAQLHGHGEPQATSPASPG